MHPVTRAASKAISTLLLTMCALGPGASSATERGFSSTLKFVYPLGTGDFVLGFDNESSLCTAAGSPKYFYVAVGQNGVSADGAKKIFAIAMMAFAMGRALSIAFDDATSACYINRVSVNN